MLIIEEDGYEDVYDFSVPHTENFFANDILVHNCAEIFLRPAGFCNLSEVVIRENDTLEMLKEKVELATILGTFQSTLTDFRYLRPVWKKNAEEERLLGVSMTGIMDHPVLSKASEQAVQWLKQLKQVAISTNNEWAEKLGINSSAAITTVKPSGCTTLDTEIKTSTGESISMEEIFSKCGYTKEFLQTLPEKSWLDVTADLPFVLDEDNNEQTITKLYVNGVNTVYEIEFEDGKSYKFTGNHKLKLITGEWKRVDELSSEDEIESL